MKRLIALLFCAGMMWGCSKSNPTAPIEDNPTLTVTLDSLYLPQTLSEGYVAVISMLFQSKATNSCTVYAEKDSIPFGTGYRWRIYPWGYVLTSGKKYTFSRDAGEPPDHGLVFYTFYYCWCFSDGKVDSTTRAVQGMQ